MKNCCWVSGLFAVVSLFSRSGMADPLTVCPQLPLNSLGHLEIVAETVRGVSSDASIASACEKSAEREYAQYFPESDKRIQSYLGRHRLSGTKEEFWIAKKILGKKPTPRGADAGKNCTTVLCAMEQVFGSKEAALRALVVGKRDGYIISVDKAEYQDPEGIEQVWKAEEIRSIDEAFSIIPDSFRRLKYMQNLYRLADGYRLASAGNSSAASAISGRIISRISGGKVISVSSGSIVFYESAFKAGVADAGNWTIEVVLHELCHHFDFQTSYEQAEVTFSERPKSGFFKMGWKRSDTSWERIPDAAFVSDYAQKSPGEDFAESCMNYMLNPALLKEKTPQKYDFLKQKVFGDKEYLSHPPFSDKPPEILMKKLSAENFCSQTFYECLPKAKIFPRGVGVQSSVSKQNGSETVTYNVYATIGQLVSKDSCFKKALDRAIQELVVLGGDDPALCVLSGGQLQREIVNACQVKIPELIRSLRQ